MKPDKILQDFLDAEFLRAQYAIIASDQQFLVRETPREVLDERVEDLRKAGLL